MAATAKRGSALVIALLLLFVTAAVSVYVLEKSVPASQGVRGIEDSNLAYYRARSGVETVLARVDPGNPFSATGATGSSGSYFASSSAPVALIPSPGEGDSDYDQNWNKIGPANPVQIMLPMNFDIAYSEFYFRLPDVDGDGQLESFSGAYYATNSGVISWFVSNGSGGYLVPSDAGQIITHGSVAKGVPVTATVSPVLINLKGATDQDSNSAPLASKFGAAGLDCGHKKCTLRLSVVQPIVTSSGQTLPYLEYRIRPMQTSSSGALTPERFLKIASQGYANGFKREIVEKIPQTTVTQGLDTTVFN